LSCDASASLAVMGGDRVGEIITLLLSMPSDMPRTFA
jgi:hypothetical protein